MCVCMCVCVCGQCLVSCYVWTDVCLFCGQCLELGLLGVLLFLLYGLKIERVVIFLLISSITGMLYM